MSGKQPVRLILFLVNGTHYALVINNICEVLGRASITPVPMVNPLLSGAMHYNGRIIPVFNMHKMLGYPACEDSVPKRREGKCVIVVNYEDRFTGLEADRTLDIVESESLRIKTVILKDFYSAIEGVGTAAEGAFFLLNTGKVLEADKPFELEVQSHILDRIKEGPK
jgi:purine-binding chemotaxis protein CheW